MRDHEEQITAAGGGIAAIGTGGTMYAEAFAEEHKLTFPLLLDRDLVSFGVAGARKGTRAGLVGPRTLLAGLRARRRGHRQSKTGRHPLMLGATHVLRPGGSVPFAWVNDDYGDNAPIADILAALP